MTQRTRQEQDPEYAALKQAFIESLSLEERLAGLSLQERLAGVSPAELRDWLSRQRIAGVSYDEFLNALTPEQRHTLVEYFSREAPSPVA